MQHKEEDKIQRILRDDPDLPRPFVEDFLLALEDVEQGNVTPFVLSNEQ